VVLRKCDDSSALRTCKEEHLELAVVMFLRFFIQVGRNCEYSMVTWNHFEVTSKFVCDVLLWNQEHTCDIAPEALTFFWHVTLSYGDTTKASGVKNA
jgi:hypothetical protein